MDLGMVDLLIPRRAGEHFEKMKDEASWDQTVPNVLIAFLVLLFAFLTITLMSAAIEGPLSGILGGFGRSMADGSLNYLLFAFYASASLLAFFVAGLFLHLIAVIFGGNGDAHVTLYMVSGLMFLFTPMLCGIMLLLLVPCIGFIAIPLLIAVFAYALMLLHKGLMAVHAMDPARSAIVVMVWLSAILTTFAILAIIGFLLGFEKLSWLLP